MALNKQPVSITFGQGLDTKSDPFQVPIGKFLELKNSVFTTANRLSKRNGFKQITNLPNTDQTTLTTLNDNLIATGSDLYAFSQSTNQWLNEGTIQPVQLDTQSLVRNSSAQESPDSAIAANNLICLSYVDTGFAYYQISDKITGQQIVNRTALPATAINPRVFLLGPYFIITFMADVSGTATLQYVAIPVASPNSPFPVATISSDIAAIGTGYDGFVVTDNTTLYLAWGGSGTTVKVAYLLPTFVVSALSTIAGASTTLMSVTADTSIRTIWVTFWDDVSTNGYTAGFDYTLTPVVQPTQTIATTIVIDTTELREITSVAANNVLSIYYEVVNSYGFSGGAASDYIATVGASAPQAPSPNPIIAEQTSADDFVQINNGSSNALAFGIQMPANVTVSGYNAKISNAAPFTPGNIYAEIWTDVAGVPTVLLATSDPVDLLTVPSVGGGDGSLYPVVQFTFSTPPALLSGVTYFFSVHIPDPGTQVNIALLDTVGPNIAAETDGADVWTGSSPFYIAYYQVLSGSAIFPPLAIVGPTNAIVRSVGLASKAFKDSAGTNYFMGVYGDTNQVDPANDSNQSSYFLINGSGQTLMRLAYANGGGYMANQVLPTVNLSEDQFNVPYMITDFLTTVNKGTNLPPGTPANAIYTQTGINLAQFSINVNSQYSSEIANALHLTGGQLWEYDGVKPVEHGFHVWPENIGFTSADTGGNLESELYYYVFTYEWTDNQGMLHRSAPSIPLLVDLTASPTDTNMVSLFVPTLRLTYKLPPNPVRIVGYRWSVAQQIYYQFTSVQMPYLNDTTVDYITIVDTLADAAILGNTLLYTTGGVVENIAAPASTASALFNNRLFLIDAEDRNLLWFSKQVIENTPVEMSDLLTLFVAPTTGAQGSTGPMTALSAMDDKLIIFKPDAIYYITGSGPDNTGANSSFSEPVFITATVGCANPRSIVLMPNGLMFQSDKGIWLLGRDLSTKYIGAPVERYNDAVITSATAIPGTNQVRFILLDNQITLVYDYFFDQWNTHSNVSAISATLYQTFHTYLNKFGQVYQETPGLYLDGSSPVLMSFKTSWINIAGLQGYERFYFANLLGTYITPFILNVGIAYDYNPTFQQAEQITPDNFSEPWGGEAYWGSGGTWGGTISGANGDIFSARLFPEKQKCQSFQLSVQEVYDRSMGQSAGEGLTLSGLALVVGLKRGYRTQSARKSFG